FLVADPGAVVLQAAIDLIGVLVVGADMVELADRQVLGVPPAGAAVVGVPEPAVVAADHIFGAGGIDPHVVPVDVRRSAGIGEALAAVFGNDRVEAHLEDAIRIPGVGHN